MNNDQVKGRIAETKGRVKKAAGKEVGNKNLERRGKIQTASGRVQAGYGDLRQDIRKSIQEGSMSELSLVL